MSLPKLEQGDPAGRRGFDVAGFLTRLGDAVALVQHARTRELRSSAADELLALVRTAKDYSRTLQGEARRRFIKMAEDISGMHLQAPDDVAFIADIDLSDRLPRYTRRRRNGEPDMKLVQLAVRTEAGQTAIVAIAEADGDHYVITGTLGGSFATGNAAHIDDARQTFSATVHKGGYREVSPAAFNVLR